jgi:hypothetical protein
MHQYPNKLIKLDLYIATCVHAMFFNSIQLLFSNKYGYSIMHAVVYLYLATLLNLH